MRAPLLLAVALVAVGCSSAERAYYRNRSVPTSAETAYSASERARWQGDPLVYELPAAPPALGEEHYARRNCSQPGPRFKGDTIVGQHDLLPGGGGPDTIPVGGMADSGPLAGPDTRAPDPVWAQRGPDPGGLAIANRVAVGGPDRRPVVKASADTMEPIPVGGMRDQDKTDWCLPEPVPTAPNALRVPVTAR